MYIFEYYLCSEPQKNIQQSFSFLLLKYEKMKEATGEPKSTFYLFQKISMAIQRGNSQCILGTSSNSKGLDEIFDFVDHNYSDE